MAQLEKLCDNSLIMPKQIPQNELDAILEAVTQFPEGASVKGLSEAMDKKLPRRTLQRRLAHLVDQDRLAIVGRGRGSRYQFPKISGKAHIVFPGFEIKGRGEVYVPISPEGKVVKEAVRLPIQDRQPVGYNRSFLDAYRPNESFYLHEKIRRHLLKSGHSTENEQPAGTYVQQIFNRLLIDLSWNSSR
ncbi:MAG: Fic family protein, partial [Thermodesulfobacteriota bacterium]|nr:Fic family protein [Thermodesulfobacteriota bacterium]